MAFELPNLPYQLDALEPHISSETLKYHHGKHHQGYVNNLNQLIKNSNFEQLSLEDIIKTAPQGSLFNNAAQTWNHSFYWQCLTPHSQTKPTGALAKAINQLFGSFSTFVQSFTDAASKNFGSGWTWLIKNSSGALEIINSSNAGCPLTMNAVPLLTIDTWEHAYYIDYRNVRADYINAFWSLVHWDFVAKNFVNS